MRRGRVGLWHRWRVTVVWAVDVVGAGVKIVVDSEIGEFRVWVVARGALGGLVMYVIEWRDTETGATELCETGSVYCYQWYSTMEYAAQHALAYNEEAYVNGWPSMYSVRAAPEGLIYPDECCMDGRPS